MSERRVSSRQHQPSLAYRRRRLFREITKFRTIIANLDNDISRLNERATLANGDAASARELIRNLTQEIARISQEELQGITGHEYARALRSYNDYIRTNPTDVEGIRSRYTEATRIHGITNAAIQEIIKPLRIEAQSKLQLLIKANKKYKSLNEDIATLTQQKYDLQNELDTMNSEYLSLSINENNACGKKQHRCTYKKRKRGQKH
jgi:chromosome segregation ATPase